MAPETSPVSYTHLDVYKRQVSMCITAKGMRAGQNAFWATLSMTIESLPPENNSTGFSNSAATSRKTKMDSASSV